ncbi:Golgi-associated RAB2B interactor protein 3-like isoform X2 [Littorina saxatilis]
MGSLTAGGASITGHIIEKKKLAEMNTQWEQFRKECSDIFGLKSKNEDMNKIARIQEVFKELTAGGVFVGRQVYAMMGAAKTVSQATAQTAVAGVTNAAETASLVGVTAAVETAATAGVAGASVTSSGATSATTGAASAAVASVTKCAATATKTGISSGAAVAAVAKTATTTAKTATTGAATTARLVAAVQAPIVVVNVFLLGLSIHDLVTASIDLHKKNKSKAGDMLRQMAAELDVFFKEDVPTLEQVEECLAFGG